MNNMEPSATTMRAWVIEAYGEPMRIMDLPVPTPGPRDLLIRMRGAEVGRWDEMLRTGACTTDRPFPLCLGLGGAGTVDAVGTSVRGFAENDTVYVCGYPLHDNGAWAEYMLVPEAYAAPAPAGLDPVRAGAVPVAAMIAHETLRDLLDVQPDDLVLITAASGGVGHFAVQIAAHCGARVVATTSRDNRDFVSALGATMVVDYDASNLGLAIQARFPEGVNKALNLKAVGSGTGDQVAQILCEGGHMVDLTGTVSVDRPAVQIDSDYTVRGDGARLLAIAHMIDDALLDVHIHGILPFERAPEALEMVLAGQVRGKVVLDMT